MMTRPVRMNRQSGAAGHGAIETATDLSTTPPIRMNTVPNRRENVVAREDAAKLLGSATIDCLLSYAPSMKCLRRQANTRLTAYGVEVCDMTPV